MTAGRRFSFLSIGKLLVALAAVAEGPFIQQASTISTREVSKTLSLQAALAVDLPPGCTADVTGEFRTPTTPSRTSLTITRTMFQSPMALTAAQEFAQAMYRVLAWL